MPSDELFSKLQRCGETLRHIVNILHVLLYKIFEENICKQRITKFKKRHSVINSTKQKQICQLRIQLKLNTALLSHCPCVRVSVRVSQA